MKKICTVLLACFLAAVMLSGCGENAVQETSDAVSQGAFNAGGEGYMLSEIVRLSDYDTDGSLGYGVVVLMQSDKAPISFSMDSGNSNSSAKSLIGLTLDNGNGGLYHYSDVSFSLNDKGSYKGKALFAFLLPKDSEFPTTGTFTYSGSPEEKIVLSFIGMELPKTEQTPFESADIKETAVADESSRPENKVLVTSYEELKSAASDTAATKIEIAADIEISDDYTLERADDIEIHIAEGMSLIVSGSFEMVNCTLTNDGFMEVAGSFVYGISGLINNNVLSVLDGGTVSSGQSDAKNFGDLSIEQGGEFYIERGTIFENAGTLTNEGYICVRDGGQLNDKGGSVVNNGTIDINSYYNGDIALITGTGILNDNR